MDYKLRLSYGEGFAFDISFYKNSYNQQEDVIEKERTGVISVNVMRVDENGKEGFLSNFVFIVSENENKYIDRIQNLCLFNKHPEQREFFLSTFNLSGISINDDNIDEKIASLFRSVSKKLFFYIYENWTESEIYGHSTFDIKEIIFS